MHLFSRKSKFYLFTFLKHDLKAGITVFFVALPLCLGISLASGAPVYSGLVAGIIGGIVVASISGSQLSVSGPAAGLTAVCAAAIVDMGSIELFFLAVMLAGVLQILLGAFKLGGFTHLIPSSVIKGMLAAIGIILISKQIPLIIGYNQPDFWRNELFNILTFDHAFQHIDNLYHSISTGAILVSIFSLLVLISWKRWVASKLPLISTSFVTVISGSLLAILFNNSELLRLDPQQFVSIPQNIFDSIKFPSFNGIFETVHVWKYAIIIAVIASLETLLSLEAVDKLDPQNRITPQNRELIAQGTGNIISGILGGLPITAVIVRGSANAEAGARTRLSAITHGIWLLVILIIAIPIVNSIPYCVLAVILIRTGYNLAKPAMIRSVYKQGREQFMPFIISVIAILFTDLLIGVLIGIAYSLYFLVRHTYRAGFVMKEQPEGHLTHYTMELALNVSFLNKKRIKQTLDKIPNYSVVEIIGTDSVYIDHDILEIIQEYKTKARNKHIQLILKNVPEVEVIELH
ncbi:MAG TPA: SulP family inorganic anion transporter [Bacteroidia bacterium]|nr:SulP family inorganic anion transporter [Bacteroidia bacterium]